MFAAKNIESPNMAEQIAKAVMEYELHTDGHMPKQVTVMMSGRTLVITLEGALTTIEQTLAQGVDGAAHVEDYHNHLFTKPPLLMWKKIRQITEGHSFEGEFDGHDPPNTCAKVFPNGTIIHVFLLLINVTASAWSGTWNNQPTIRTPL